MSNLNISALIISFLIGICAYSQDIKNVKLDRAIIEADGQLSKESLPKFLAQAHRENLLENPSFAKDSCLKAEKIDAVGSFNTLQLFRVTSTCEPNKTSQYIVKEARHGLSEASSLQAIEKYPRMKELFALKMPPRNLPSLALPIAYLSYNDGSVDHYLTVMPLAQGKVLCKTITDFRDNQSEQNKEKLEKAYRTIGREMSSFYQRFMDKTPYAETVIGSSIQHGDFHCYNIFYDENNDHLTLIDNETIASSLNNKIMPTEDIFKLFLGLFSESEPAERKEVIEGIDLKLWHNLAFKSFVQGFVGAFPPAERAQALKELKKIFNTNIKLPWLDISHSKLQELREKYINPVFDSLAT